MPPRAKPGQGQGMLLEIAAGELQAPTEPVFTPSDADPVATSLHEYYGTLAKAVVAIARARSNEDGFPKLPDSSAPVKNRVLEHEGPQDTKERIAKSAPKHRMAAFEILRKQTKRENERLVKYAKATGHFSVESVNHLPADVLTLEFKFFGRGPLTQEQAEEFETKRNRLYRQARKHARKAAQ